MTQYSRTRPVVPRETITAAKHFWRIALGADILSSIQMRWFDGTIDANGSVVVYFSDMDNPTKPAVAGTVDLTEWDADTSISFTGPAASAAGSEILPLGNNGSKWVLIEITFTGVGEVEFWKHGKA